MPKKAQPALYDGHHQHHQHSGSETFGGKGFLLRRRSGGHEFSGLRVVNRTGWLTLDHYRCRCVGLKRNFFHRRKHRMDYSDYAGENRQKRFQTMAAVSIRYRSQHERVAWRNVIAGDFSYSTSRSNT